MRKVYLLLILIVFLQSCTTYKAIKTEDVSNVYILYNDSISFWDNGYKLPGGETISWDKENVAIKKALKQYLPSVTTLKSESPHYLKDFLQSKRPISYYPIKVAPLREFGYIEMKDGEIIFYGVMQETLIDLSKDKFYSTKNHEKPNL